jgi:hypothetical protein
MTKERISFHFSHYICPKNESALWMAKFTMVQSLSNTVYGKKILYSLQIFSTLQMEYNLKYNTEYVISNSEIKLQFANKNIEYK